MLGTSLTEEEVRRRQIQQYELMKIKHAEKEREKLARKRQEKWKRYEHIDMGQKLSDAGQEGQDEQIARTLQQSVHDEKVIDYILKLERENKKLREEKEREQLEKLQSATCSAVTRSSQSDSPRRLPFVNSCTNSPTQRAVSVDAQINKLPRVDQIPVALLDVNANQAPGPSSKELQKMKQEKFKREMELAREKMQKLYSQNLQKEQ